MGNQKTSLKVKDKARNKIGLMGEEETYYDHFQSFVIDPKMLQSKLVGL